MVTPVLAARAIERRYGRRVALAPTDFQLERGELVVLVGPNGAGKSTLLSLLAGVLPPSGGLVEFADPSPSVGWAPQRPALYGHLSARENLELFARLASAGSAGLDDPVQSAAAVLGQVGLTVEDEDQRATELSVGNQQRLNLALALLGDPEVLLLDEPTASLDPKQRDRLWTLLLERRTRGQTAVVATHSPEEAARLASRAVMLVDGLVVRDGAPAEIAAAMTS